MRMGHVMALVGASLTLLGGFVLPWHTFELAGVSAMAVEVAPAGQLVLGLAALALVTSGLGLRLGGERRRRALATATLAVALFALAWALLSHMGRTSFFELQPGEQVTMGAGYTLALWGLALALVGPLVVLASEERLDPDRPLLRAAVLWNGTVLSERLVRTGERFSAGDLDRRPLFQVDEQGESSLLVYGGLRGELNQGPVTRAIAELAPAGDEPRRVPLAMGDWGLVEVEAVQVFFQLVRPEGRVPRRPFLAFDEVVTSAVAVSFLLQIGFILLALFLWEERAERAVKTAERKTLSVDVVLTPPPRDDEPLEEPVDDAQHREGEAGKRAEGEEGRFGDHEAPPEQESKVPRRDAPMVNQVDPHDLDPAETGLNELLRQQKQLGQGPIAEILGQDEGFERKLVVAMNGEGDELVIGPGSDGLGFHDGGRGGGGDDGPGRIHGTARFDTGGGPSVIARVGPKPKRRVAAMNLGVGAAEGFCRESNLRSVVRRRAGAIRACYEKRLQVRAGLAGKMTARWTIGLDGAVASATTVSSNLGDAEVETCVLRAIRRMRFGAPEGGVCVVQWPFVFSSGQ